MNRDDIIRMAREASGGMLSYDAEGNWRLNETEVAHFAALVAAAEREKVAAWMTERSYATGHGDTTEDLLKELEWQVRESEREACIRACDSVDLVGADECIAAIRARGNNA